MPRKKKHPYQTWLVLPDMQIPFEDKVTMRAVEAYMADVAESDHPFDGYINLGDFLDFSEISRWNKNNPRAKRGQAVRKSFRGDQGCR